MGKIKRVWAISWGKKSGARSHQESRGALCAHCFSKKNLRLITRELEEIIKVHTPAFSLDNEALPNVICDGCRVVMLYLHKVYIIFRYFRICIDI